MTLLSTVLQFVGYITSKSMVFKNGPLTTETGVLNYFIIDHVSRTQLPQTDFSRRNIGSVPPFFLQVFYAIHLNEFLREK